jgi:hypothetical protein
MLKFSEEHGKTSRKTNQIMKKLIDTLFPSCSVTRANRLVNRIRTLLLPLTTGSISDNEQEKVFLCKQWKPQATGIFQYHVY